MQEKIRSEMIASMKAKDATKTSVLKGLIAAFMNELVSKGKKPGDPISDEECSAVIKRAVKQRKDSIEQFNKGGRPELAAKEEAELKILETYLPATLPREEVEKVAREVKEKMGVTDKSKMGILMGGVMRELKGKADGAVVKEVVESLFI